MLEQQLRQQLRQQRVGAPRSGARGCPHAVEQLPVTAGWQEATAGCPTPCALRPPPHLPPHALCPPPLLPPPAGTCAGAVGPAAAQAGGRLLRAAAAAPRLGPEAVPCHVARPLAAPAQRVGALAAVVPELGTEEAGALAGGRVGAVARLVALAAALEAAEACLLHIGVKVPGPGRKGNGEGRMKRWCRPCGIVAGRQADGREGGRAGRRAGRDRQGGRQAGAGKLPA